MDRDRVKIQAIDILEKDIKEDLKIKKIEKSDNLIEKGMSSLMIMKASNKLRKLGIKLSFAKLMEHPTFEEWEKLIEEAEIKKTKKNKKRREGVVENEEFPLTDVQYSYWVGRDDEQLLGGIGCHAYLEIDGKNIDVIKLNNAWNIVQKQHPMLRASFTKDGKQKILEKPYSEQIAIYDLADLEENEIEMKLYEIREAISHRKLRVEKGEVAGLSIALLKANKTKIFLDIDLLVADVLSLSILIKELAGVYSGQELKTSNYTFKDYILENEIDREALEIDKKYWEKKIKSIAIEAPNLPIEKKPNFISKVKFKRRKKIIEKDCWEKIKKTAAEYKVTPSIILLSCYALILERWCNQETFLINIPLFNRDTENKNLKNMIADFTNLILVDYRRKEKETFLETVKRVNGTFLENVAHSSYSGVNVQREIYKNNGTKDFIAPIVFACNIDYSLETELSKKVFGDISYMISQTPQVWLDFQTYIIEENLILCWDAIEELFPEKLLDDMFNSLSEIVIKLGEKKNWDIEIDVLPKNQKEIRENEVKKINPLKYPNKTLYSEFLENVKKYPDKIALINSVDKVKVSYKEVYEKALRVSNELIDLGIQKGDYVGIIQPRDEKQVYGILGILFAGAVYVPISINQPKKRREKIYEQIGIKNVISNSKVIEKLKLDKVNLINIDNIEIKKIRTEKVVKIQSQDSAYVIMTSGSTGIPKGVEVSHNSAMNTILDVNERNKINNEDAVLMVSGIDFDLSVYDIFGLLSVGGTIVLLNEERFKEPDLWIKAIKEYNVTLWNSVPILFEMLMAEAEEQKIELNLKVVMLSGDWIPVDLPGRFYKINKGGQVVAMGGATEASIWSNYFNVPRELPNNLISIPYGKPLRNQVYRVVDGLGRICPDYVKGELLIGGEGLAKGYKGDSPLTNEKFFNDEIRWYKTGDFGRTWNDGTIEFLGRKDGQVKIKGFRIEIGEIERVINNLDIVSEACVQVLGKENGKEIVAYAVENGKHVINADDINRKLKDLIPEYMIPTKYYITKDRIELSNRKLDKKQISELLSEEFSKENISVEKDEIKSDVEKKIELIWREVLNRKNISIAENYFMLGGDSLKAVLVVNKLKKQFNLFEEISIGMIFKYPTIKELGEQISKLINEFEVEEI